MPLLTEQDQEMYADEIASYYSERDGGGPGGKKKKKKKRDPESVTFVAARAEAKRKAQEAQVAVAKGDLLKTLNRFPELNAQQEEAFFYQYIAWVNESLKSGMTLINDEADLEYKAVKSSKGAGGQNVNKVASAVICRHKISNIFVRNQETRDQFRNKLNARFILGERLTAHLEDWKTYLSGSELTKEQLENMVLEASSH